MQLGTCIGNQAHFTVVCELLNVVVDGRGRGYLSGVPKSLAEQVQDAALWLDFGNETFEGVLDETLGLNGVVFAPKDGVL
jgi:hypothetical protein